jgi:hypothetical protein
MPHASPSALITDKGQRVLLRIHGRLYDMSQNELRTLLGLPAGSAGLGITIDGDQLRFEFAADHRTVDMSAGQLQRRLAKQKTSGTSRQSTTG